MAPYRYDPAFVAAQYDQLAEGEWQRLTSSPIDEVNLHIHAHYLRQLIPAGSTVLEIGAGAGRFTQILAELGARVWVGDLSPVQLDLNRRYAAEFGFEPAVVERRQVDITDLSAYADASFDRVVAYGGPFSYVLERRGDELTTVRQDAAKWAELLRMEVDASADPGCVGMGTHLIFAAQKPG